MPILRGPIKHPTTSAQSASGAINIELSPQPFTITRMYAVVLGNFTTSAATAFNDPYDRVVSRLTCLGQSGNTFFDFSEMRSPYHMSRMYRHGTKRPTTQGATVSNQALYWAYNFHFGTSPRKVDSATWEEEDNPYDLSAGIPITGKGNLTLSGAWGASAAPGTGYTTNSGTLYIYLMGVQPEMGDPDTAFQPVAFPAWSMATLDPTATSTLYSTSYSVPAGDYLHSVLILSALGANAPRSSSMLGSFRFYSQIETRELLSSDEYNGLEQVLQSTGANGYPESDDLDLGTTGVPAATAARDLGLLWLPIYAKVNQGHPLYGLDMTRVATGDFLFQYGVASVTGTAVMHALFRRYKLNPDHPANREQLAKAA